MNRLNQNGTRKGQLLYSIHTFIYSYFYQFLAVFREKGRMNFGGNRTYLFISADRPLVSELLSLFYNVGKTSGKETVSMTETLAALVELMPKDKNKDKAPALAKQGCQLSQRLN